ncbi:hypothetical protein [Actinomadura madurae]|uniref:hypothetical protein n=1 Tax=Actinomadura madurae TaxID=1993 RepID=UPI0020D23BF0|nr:hypothetical protein [Actinomadura madurae]MCQ0020084.1 hypothetical protein [Actinomadura madurae]
MDATDEALERLPRDERELRVRLLTTLAMELEGERHDRGLQASEEALRTARDLDDPELIAVALNGAYINRYRTAEDLAERLRIASELLDVATEHDLGTYRVLAHLQLQQASVAALDPPAAHRHLAEGRRLADQYGLPLLARIADWDAGLVRAFTAPAEEAEHAFAEVGRAIGRTNIWFSERGMAVLGPFCLRVVQGRAGEMVDEAAWLHGQWGHVAATADVYALALASAGPRRGRPAGRRRGGARPARLLLRPHHGDPRAPGRGPRRPPPGRGGLRAPPALRGALLRRRHRRRHGRPGRAHPRRPRPLPRPPGGRGGRALPARRRRRRPPRRGLLDRDGHRGARPARHRGMTRHDYTVRARTRRTPQ